MERTSQNDNIHCYIMEGQDHWSVLAPLTRALAQKILADTRAECNIAITQEELGFRFSYPYLWDMDDVSENGEISYTLTSRYEGENVWDLSQLLFDVYLPEEKVGTRRADLIFRTVLRSGLVEWYLCKW